MVLVIAISGCINSETNHPTNSFHSGNWRLDSDFFAVNHDWNNEMDSLYGEYDAFRENDTIVLIGKGEQQNTGKIYDIKVVMENQGNNTKVSYYLDGKINSYVLIKGYNKDRVFNVSSKFWENHTDGKTYENIYYKCAKITKLY